METPIKPIKKYNIIYADCPWKFNNKNTGGSMTSGSANQYNVLSVEELCKLPIEKIIADDSILFSWWVGSMVEEAITVARAWGFKLKTMSGFTWVKKTKNWKDWFGMGFWTRQGTENILIATRGQPVRRAANVRQVQPLESFNESVEARNKGHSIKPDLFRDKIVELCGDLPRIELFARESNPGWDVWGKEVQSSIDFSKLM